MLHIKVFIDFIFVHAYTLHTCSSVHSPKSLFYLHSPSRCLVNTFQAHVRFQFLSFFRWISFFQFFHSPYRFSGHSPHNCFVYTLQADITFLYFTILIDLILFMLTLSTHILVLTLQSVFSLHSPSRCLVYTLQAHDRFLSPIFTGFHFSMLLLSIQI